LENRGCFPDATEKHLQVAKTNAINCVKTLSLTLGNIQIEEVAVENCLNAASNDGNEVEEAFHVVAIDPVENVQCTIDAECKQVVACNGLRFTSLAYHEQLRQNRYRFQVDGKRP